MAFKNPFTAKKDSMNTQQDTMENEGIKEPGNTLDSTAEELQRQSQAEASEQRPLEENAVEKLSAELADMKDQHMRLYAEFDNFRKRSHKERAEYLKSAGGEMVMSLLPVLDDLERAFKVSASLDDKDPFKEGMLLIYHKMKNIMEQKGLKAMSSIGEDFNVDVHEAVTNIPVEDEQQKGKVIDELEKGYWFNDKVIRHAKVVVGN